MMRIVALVKRLDHVCCRYRLAAYRPFFERTGHQLDLQTWPKGWWSRLRLRRQIGRADAIIIQRRLASAGQIASLRQMADFLVYDFDDAIFLRDSFTPGGPHSPGRAEGFAHMVKSVDALVAGNSFLQEHAALWARPENIHVIPTCLDPARYLLAGRHHRGDIQLVWIGSASTLRGLKCVRPLLEALGRDRPELRLRIICDRFLELSALPVVRCPWSAEREVHDLAAGDIGISWLPDDLWSQGKCGLKVLQYMAAGLPVVASPVGVQGKLVRHGQTGYLAETQDEWREAIDRLAAAPDLRLQMGRAGRAFVEEHYHVARGGARWTALLESLQARGRVFEPTGSYGATPRGLEDSPAGLAGKRHE